MTCDHQTDFLVHDREGVHRASKGKSWLQRKMPCKIQEAVAWQPRSCSSIQRLAHPIVQRETVHSTYVSNEARLIQS